jgi:LPS-assembly protein
MALRTRSLLTTRRAMPGLAASRGHHFRPWHGTLLSCLMACCFSFAIAGTAFAQAGQTLGQKSYTNDLGKILKPPSIGKSEPMLLQADEMIYDNENNRVTARGNVEIYYGNYILLADQVIYDRNANTLAAQGNVRIKDPDGAIITSNQMTLTDDFRDGFINTLRVVTKEDTRIVAQSATREAGNVTVFQKGWFTPCKPCESNPDRPPSWRLRAQKIIHRTDEATLTYRNVFLDFFGVPVLWAPYFQSADPTVKRKSGFLMPQYAQSSRLGTTVTVPYYFALADNYDLTFVPMYTSKEGTLLQGSWRQQLANGGYRVDLHGVFDDGSFSMPGGEEFRGSIATQGKFALNPYWSWGWDVTAQTDSTFNRFYGISPNFEGSMPSFADTQIQTEEVSQVYLEGLEDRNYASLRFYDTRDLNKPTVPGSNAIVYPIIDYDYILKQPIIGGELSFNSNAMALTNDDGTNSDRAIVQMNWRRQMIDGIGEVFTPFANLRGDVYQVNDFVDPTNNTQENGPILRGNAVAGAEYSYPLIATTGNVAHVIEPVGQIIVRPATVGVNQSEIPNEDANSLVFDDTLLFEIDKFSGYDRLETGTRANVGMRYTAQLPSGAYARLVFGESYQLAGENSFNLPEFQNSGLATSASDYVTGLYLQAARYLSFTAQTRFDHDTFELMRTDLGATANVGPINVMMNYANIAPGAESLSTSTEAGLLSPTTPVCTSTSSTNCVVCPTGSTANTVNNVTGCTPVRDEEILGRGTLTLTDNWALLGVARYDLANSQMISDGVGLQYQNDCLILAVTYSQSNIQEQDIKPDQRVMVNLSLKYLGTYQYTSDAFGDTGAQAEVKSN